MPVFHCLPTSVVDPNTLNLDPDPGFWPNWDPDPGLYNKFQKKKLKIILEKNIHISSKKYRYIIKKL